MQRALHLFPEAQPEEVVVFLCRGSWTDEEDYELICLFLRFGKKWSKMAKHIQGRNENSIKNRFFLMF